MVLDPKKMSRWLAYGLAALLALAAAVDLVVKQWPAKPAAAVSSRSMGGTASGGSGSRSGAPSTRR